LFGYELKDGMFYIGSGLGSVSSSHWPEPALIDPAQPIDLRNRDDEGRTMSYWPSYSAISPQARSAYLHWLSTGRQAPRAYIGYVFLYFYGLERRALHDAIDDPGARTDIADIVRETERLLGIYSSSRSFSRYASSFLAFIASRDGRSDRLSTTPPPTGGTGIPAALRIGIAQHAKSGTPLPGTWALAWLRSDPEAYLRTPAFRCATDFDRLFTARYSELYGAKGLPLRDCKTRVRIEHNPASASFGRRPITLDLDLPDVCALTGPQRALRELGQRCCDELNGLSRLLSRSPTARDSLAAAAVLPAALLSLEPSGAMRKLLDVVEPGLSGAGSGVLRADALIEAWSDGTPVERIAKREAVLLAQALHRVRVGIEPDVRFGGQVLQRGGRVSVYRLDDGAPESPSSQYVAGSLLLQLASLVATADGHVTPEEEQRLREHISRALRLDRHETARLNAHLTWMLAEPPGMTGIKRRLQLLDDSQRVAVGQFLVHVALADGRVDPSEIRILTRIYALLGLDPARVHADIHATATAVVTAADAPVTVRPAQPDSPGYALPQQPPQARPSRRRRSEPIRKPAASLDMDVIEAKLKESAGVAAILAGIFVDDAAPAPSAPARTPDTPVVSGLGPPYSALLRRLQLKASWTRSEYDALVGEFGLMPEATFEALNDAAFERCSEPLCEGDDPLTINSAVLSAMLS